MKPIVIAIALFSANALFNDIQAQDKWSEISIGSSQVFQSIQFVTSEVGYLVPKDGLLYKSIDGGSTWDEVASLNCKGSNIYYNQVYFLNEDVGYVTTGTNSSSYQLYKTNDGAITWQNISPGTNIGRGLQVEFLDENIGYAIAENISETRFWRTKNGGSSWQEFRTDLMTTSGTPIVPKLRVEKEGVVYLFCGDGSFQYKGRLVVSNDDGVTWSFTDLPDINTLITDFQQLSNDAWYASTYRGDIYKSSDAGGSWQLYWNVQEAIKEIHFLTEQKAFVMLDKRVIYTNDAGVNWHTLVQTSGYMQDMSFYVDAIGYAVDSESNLYKSFGGLGLKNNLSETLSVYPNPVIDVLTISGLPNEQLEIHLTDLLGKEVYAGSSYAKDIVQFNTLGFKSGMYILSIRGGNSTVTNHRIVIQ